MVTECKRFDHVSLLSTWTNITASNTIKQQEFKLIHGQINVGTTSSPGSNFVTTMMRMWDKEFRCIGNKAGYSFLEDRECGGLTVLLADHPAPVFISSTAETCVEVTDILQTAQLAKIKVKLITCRGTSLTVDNPASSDAYNAVVTPAQYIRDG